MSDAKVLKLADEELKDVSGGLIFTACDPAKELDEGGWGCPICSKKMRYCGTRRGDAYCYRCDEHGDFARQRGYWYTF